VIGVTVPVEVESDEPYLHTFRGKFGRDFGLKCLNVTRFLTKFLWLTVEEGANLSRLEGVNEVGACRRNPERRRASNSGGESGFQLEAQPTE
jgi:hypothetical protein